MTTMRFPVELWDSEADRAAVLAAAVEGSDAPMAVVDGLGNVVFVNPAAESLWNEPAEALLNRAVVSLLGVDATRGGADAFGARLEAGEAWEERARPRRAGASRPGAARTARIQPVASRRRGRPGRVIAAVVALPK